MRAFKPTFPSTFLPTVAALAILAAAPAGAQQPRTFEDLFSPRQTFPQQQQQQPPQQRQPGGVETSPLPPPGAPRDSAPDPWAQQRQPQQQPQPQQPQQELPQQRQTQPQPQPQPQQQPERQQQARPQQPAAPSEETVEPAPQLRIANPTAVFSGLDKITGRIFPFEVAMGETVQFGALQVTPRACYTRPPTEPQNTSGFVEVDELTLDGKMRRLFTGWMFAASPGLHAVEHAIYDVWLVDCKNSAPEVAKSKS